GQTSPCLWTPLPQSRLCPGDRCKHACCSYNGDVYVLGGRDSSCLGDFWKYGFLYVFGGMLDSAYTWRKCPLWVFETSQRPSNRKGHSAVVLGSAMLVYGGFMDLKGTSQEFWSLNLTQTQSLRRGLQG
uniref:Si:dkey-3d4.3 n=1 Tax=Cyprinodon variegatus TaxID=28743 RepID=A0A3Q2DX01_CYPVA